MPSSILHQPSSIFHLPPFGGDKRGAFLLLANICCICALAQMQRYNPNFQLQHIYSSPSGSEQTETPSSFLHPPSSFCDTIPIEIEDDQIYIRVFINQQPYRFNIDTGSSQGMIFTNSKLLHQPSSIPSLPPFGGDKRGASFGGDKRGASSALPPPSTIKLTPLGNIISRDANHHIDTLRVLQLPPFNIPLANQQPSSIPSLPPFGGDKRGAPFRGDGRVSIQISHYVATLMPRPAISNNYDAIIGFDLFNHPLVAKIDAQQRILILSNNRKAFSQEEQQGYNVKYKLKWFVPYINVSPFQQHNDEALFDLGATQLYTMARQTYKQLLPPPSSINHLPTFGGDKRGASLLRQTEGQAYGQLAIAAHGTENPDTVTFLHLDRLKFQNFQFRNLRAITTQGSSRIGAQILQYGAIIINPFRRQITFLPYNNTDNTNVDNPPFQVAFIPINTSSIPLPPPFGGNERGASVAVGLINPQSHPYKAGMRQGDIILQIDQHPILSFQQFKQFRFAKGENHLFRLRDKNGNEKSILCIIKP